MLGTQRQKLGDPGRPRLGSLRAGETVSPLQHIWSMSVQGQFFLGMMLIALFSAGLLKLFAKPLARIGTERGVRFLVGLGVGAAFALAVSVGADPAAAAQKAGCMACHAMDKKLVGPAFKDIAAKYKGQDVVAKLVDKVRKGGAGVFGPVPMLPNPPDKINDADLKAAVEFILKS